MKVKFPPYLAAFLLVSSNIGAVTVGTPSGSHSTDPLDGSPWDNVLNVSGTQGSAVYLGGGWVLTANHVFDDSPSATSSSVIFEGITYDADPLHIYELANPISISLTGDPNPDLRLYRLTNSLGLPSVSLGSVNAGTDVVMTGFGGGKSWGTNEVTATGIPLAVNGRDTQLFFTAYDDTIAGEAQGRTGDSGGATFYEVTTGLPSSQGWYLGGIMVAIGEVSGEDGTFHADIGTYRSDINNIIATNGSAPPVVPEPTTFCLAALGLCGVLRRKR
ncbi:trypsin-like peptidase domain-containing protein [Roseibacillus persicicus]|uniref:trypsin-like peptidase domain-containing protein n=1 Tax=Roseibacillus persicicus TaxID=454148 RepID=UPI00280E1523|nr:trypsin-like peptidase domain-containing protein [Roseibacillus persicicus]MDQ8191733.1 trypsin-like peptidase domain-containing protein [Roseibacillus persicicus]